MPRNDFIKDLGMIWCPYREMLIKNLENIQNDPFRDFAEKIDSKVSFCFIGVNLNDIGH